MTQDLIVVKVDKARALLAECTTAEQAKRVADMARAAEVYAQRQGLSDEIVRHATAIKVDSLTLMGEFLKTKSPRGPGPGRGRKGENKTNSPGELVFGLPDGISPKESSNAQALADLKNQEPALHEQVRTGVLSVKAAAAKVRRQRKETKKKETQKAAAKVIDSPSDSWRVEHADCLSWLKAQPVGSIDLVFGSPPYEQARLYLENGKDSGIARSTEEWVKWMAEVCQAALHCCKGLVAFVVEGQTKQYCWSASPAMLISDLRRAGIAVRKPPIYYRVGIPGSGGPDWLRNDYEFVVCCTNGGELPWSENKAMGHAPKYRPGGNPTHRTQDGSRVNGEVGYASMEDRGNVGPHRARQQAGREYAPPEIANPGNVIKCVAGGGNMGDDLCHENEAPFPETLAEFFILSFCVPGGVTCDPFCGSGTTGKMAVKHGRRFVGCDIRESQIRLAKRRLREVQPLLPLEV